MSTWRIESVAHDGAHITATVQLAPSKGETFEPFVFEMNVHGESPEAMRALVAAEAERKRSAALVVSSLVGVTGECGPIIEASADTEEGN